MFVAEVVHGSDAKDSIQRTILGIEMAKGKKRVLTSSSKDEDSQHTGNIKDTKENIPEMNTDSSCKAQLNIQCPRSPSKPRSPLSENSSPVIEEGKGSRADTSKLMPNRRKSEILESKEEQKSESCLVSESSVQTTELGEKDAISPINAVAPEQVFVSKPQRQTRHKLKVKKPDNKVSQNRKVTDYFPIRRSSRKTKAELKNEEHRHLDDLIKNGIEEGMQVKHMVGKGRGVFAVKGFKKGEFVVEYHGDLLDLADAKKRESLYTLDPETGCYMYYFQYQTKTYCVDATKETSRLGRLLNHSKNGNCQTRLHDIDGKPHLVLVASRDIEADEELLYDYGDRSKASLSAHPWLKY